MKWQGQFIEPRTIHLVATPRAQVHRRQRPGLFRPGALPPNVPRRPAR